jgi:predicted metal-binding protein
MSLWIAVPCNLGMPAATGMISSFALYCVDARCFPSCCWTDPGKLEIGQKIVAHVICGGCEFFMIWRRMHAFLVQKTQHVYHVLKLWLANYLGCHTRYGSLRVDENLDP